MSMRLVKQQLAALSGKGSSGSVGTEEGTPVGKDPKDRRRKRKKDSSLAVKQAKKKSKSSLTEEEIKAANLEYLRKSQPAEKSADLMSKVALQTHLITGRLLSIFLWLDIATSLLDCRPLSHTLPARVASPARPSEGSAGRQIQLGMDSYWRAKSLHGITAHAHRCSLHLLSACPSTARPRRDATGRASQGCASAASRIHKHSSACHSLHSAPTRRQGQDLRSHRGDVSISAATTGAAAGHSSPLHASQTEPAVLPISCSSPGRRASLARTPTRGSVAASAGAGSLMDVFQAIQAQMQGMAASDEPPLADVDVSHMAFHPAGRNDVYDCAPRSIIACCKGISTPLTIVPSMLQCSMFLAMPC